MFQTKPVVNLTKKGYREINDYIVENYSEDAEKLMNIFKDALKNTIHFDPDAKTSQSVIHKKTEQRKQLLETEGVSQYDKYTKPRYEKLKTIFPDVPKRTLFTHTIQELQKLSLNNLNK